jgi:hypothetical protein
VDDLEIPLITAIMLGPPTPMIYRKGAKVAKKSKAIVFELLSTFGVSRLMFNVRNVSICGLIFLFCYSADSGRILPTSATSVSPQ